VGYILIAFTSLSIIANTSILLFFGMKSLKDKAKLLRVKILAYCKKRKYKNIRKKILKFNRIKPVKNEDLDFAFEDEPNG